MTSLVPDTNILIHCRLLSDIDICSDIDPEIFEVAVPLVVIDELDKLKNSTVTRTARRAARWIGMLEQATFGSFEIRPGCILRVLPDNDDRDRLLWSDDEIITRCIELSESERSSVILLSNDLGMRVRAAAKFRNRSNLRVLKAPQSLLLDEVDPQEQEMARLRSQLEERSRSGVRISASFGGQSFMQSAPFRVVKHPGVDELVARRVARVSKPDTRPAARATYSSISVRPTNGQIRAYERDLNVWEGNYRKWIEHKIEVLELGEAAVRLEHLQMLNDGDTTAEDVELRLSIPDCPGISFVAASQIGEEAVHLEPHPPARPQSVLEPSFGSPVHLDYDFVENDTIHWRTSNGEAVRTLEQLRPHGRPYTFEDVLCVIPNNTREPIIRGFSIHWEILAAKPEYRNQGTLHVKPRQIPDLNLNDGRTEQAPGIDH